ncbi:DNA-directed RNA polymerase III subunit RPC4 isoform X3 [Hippocampus comes]|uniref:DNA-directed RNA polymerase III subunit RPC4 isoform X3 n=1 Tax=Hippocampus comes TaxID=109280 RepID=UPI00094ECA18|nr:PREDICTED: DNA-directed RNA polymerase III subunit RPC4-like isoform X3 [Hippocampus comes]
MAKKDAEEVPSSSGMNSGASLSITASRGLHGLGLGCLPSPATARRLQSLRNRDLTLGGALKKTKKTFEPNINAVRKSKDDYRLKEEAQVIPKRERKQRDNRRGENRGRRKEKPQTIQCHSIFEQGPADTPRKTGAAAGVCDATAFPNCKTVKKEPQDSDDEDELLRKLQRDDFISDPSLRNDAKLKPIQLPLCQTSTTSSQEKPLLLASPSSGPQLKTGHNRDQPSLVEILQCLCLSGKEELFFMQLPDCMPVREQKAEPSPGPRFEKVTKDKKPLHGKAQVEPTESPSVTCSPVLSEFPEGFLGKLRIRKSGKVEMKLGDIVMDITDGTALSFLQQLVSVNLADGKTGDMMVLGNIQHKLVLSPNFQTLLEESTQQQQGS